MFLCLHFLVGLRRRDFAGFALCNSARPSPNGTAALSTSPRFSQNQSFPSCRALFILIAFTHKSLCSYSSPILYVETLPAFSLFPVVFFFIARQVSCSCLPFPTLGSSRPVGPVHACSFLYYTLHALWPRDRTALCLLRSGTGTVPSPLPPLSVPPLPLADPFEVHQCFSSFQFPFFLFPSSPWFFPNPFPLLIPALPAAAVSRTLFSFALRRSVHPVVCAGPAVRNWAIGERKA